MDKSRARQHHSGLVSCGWRCGRAPQWLGETVARFFWTCEPNLVEMQLRRIGSAKGIVHVSLSSAHTCSQMFCPLPSFLAVFKARGERGVRCMGPSAADKLYTHQLFHSLACVCKGMHAPDTTGEMYATAPYTLAIQFGQYCANTVAEGGDTLTAPINVFASILRTMHRQGFSLANLQRVVAMWATEIKADKFKRLAEQLFQMTVSALSINKVSAGLHTLSLSLRSRTRTRWWTSFWTSGPKINCPSLRVHSTRCSGASVTGTQI